MPPFEHSFNLVLNAHYNKRCQNLGSDSFWFCSAGLQPGTAFKMPT